MRFDLKYFGWNTCGPKYVLSRLLLVNLCRFDLWVHLFLGDRLGVLVVDWSCFARHAFLSLSVVCFQSPSVSFPKPTPICCWVAFPFFRNCGVFLNGGVWCSTGAVESLCGADILPGRMSWQSLIVRLLSWCALHTPRGLVRPDALVSGPTSPFPQVPL